MHVTPTMAPWRPLALSSFRFYSTSAEKPPLKLVAELRKLTEVSITKAREALAASNNDVSAALKWLQNDLAVSGAKKAAKVAHRTAGEGLVGASVLPRRTGSSPGGVRAALVELNCETDFVARNALFGRLVAICLMLTSGSLSHTLLGKEFWLIQAPRWLLLEWACLVLTEVKEFMNMLAEDAPP